jgi:dephospho-CoA kinase
MHVFGLTGGIGSGKSTVAARWRERGVPVVDSDQLAREVVDPGTEGLQQIVGAFGPAFVSPDGALDRAAVARLVFRDPEARARLEAIVHPRVRALADERFAALRAAGEPLACNEVPLLVEVGLAEQLRPLVVVTASEAKRIARTVARDGSSEDQVRARIHAQMPLADKAKLADHVIDNDGPLERTLAETDHVLRAICQALDIDPGRYLGGASPAS